MVYSNDVVVVYPLHQLLIVGESDLPACGPSVIFSVHLASCAVTPVGFVHKSMGDHVCIVKRGAVGARVWEV